MKTVAEKIRELKEKEGQIKGMGGAKAVEKQRASGKLTARERLDLFFDPGTFRETDIFVTHRCVNFGMEKVEIPADGVVTGFGKVNGRPVFAFAQDFTVSRRVAGRDAQQEDLQGHGPGLEGRGAVCGVQRLRRGPDPGGRGFFERLRADFLPERHRQRRHPPDLRHHGTHRRGRGLLPGHDRLHLHGEEHVVHVHHRPGRHQERHRGGDQRAPGRTSSRASPARRSPSRIWAAPWPTT